MPGVQHTFFCVAATHVCMYAHLFMFETYV